MKKAIATLALLMATVSNAEERVVKPVDHARLAAAFYSRLPKEEQYYTRFLSFYAVPEESLDAARQVTWFWLNSMSREPSIEIPRAVPLSDKRLYRIDLRDYGWTTGGWGKIQTAQKIFYDGYTVRADWLVWYTSDASSSQGYYDLLFSLERYPEQHEWWPGGEHNGVNYAPGWYKKARAGKENFPANEDDWNVAFGADKSFEILKDKERRLQVDRGAIVDEGDSIVAYHNRLLLRVPVLQGGWWKTFDVKETREERDIPDHLLVDFTRKKAIEFKHDASEYIVNLPNGGQAYLLSNGQGDRVEFADPFIARDTSGFKNKVVVRTAGSCVVCHANGINEPRHVLGDLADLGIDLKAKKETQRRLKAFYLSNLGKLIKQDQDTYLEFLQKTSGLDGEKNAVAFKTFTQFYQNPVTLVQACRELGVSEDEMKVLARKSLKFRSVGLTRGKAVPRESWDAEIYRELYLIHESEKHQ